jgi:hypothetical protein
MLFLPPYEQILGSTCLRMALDIGRPLCIL